MVPTLQQNSPSIKLDDIYSALVELCKVNNPDERYVRIFKNLKSINEINSLKFEGLLNTLNLNDLLPTTPDFLLTELMTAQSENIGTSNPSPQLNWKFTELESNQLDNFEMLLNMVALNVLDLWKISPNAEIKFESTILIYIYEIHLQKLLSIQTIFQKWDHSIKGCLRCLETTKTSFDSFHEVCLLYRSSYKLVSYWINGAGKITQHLTSQISNKKFTIIDTKALKKELLEKEYSLNEDTIRNFKRNFDYLWYLTDHKCYNDTSNSLYFKTWRNSFRYLEGKCDLKSSNQNINKVEANGILESDDSFTSVSGEDKDEKNRNEISNKDI